MTRRKAPAFFFVGFTFRGLLPAVQQCAAGFFLEINMAFHVPESLRLKTGPFGSTTDCGNNGAFRIPSRPGHTPFTVIASDQMGWEHVSASLPHRCPTWEEMCKVKALFWDDEDCVMQLHPPKSEWISNHPYCLHLWRPIHGCMAIPMPPGVLVGFK